MEIRYLFYIVNEGGPMHNYSCRANDPDRILFQYLPIVKGYSMHQGPNMSIKHEILFLPLFNDITVD